MTVLIVVVLLTVAISASCSLFEAVLYSTRLSTVEAAKKKKKMMRVASVFSEMKKNVAPPIAAILILNTIANTAGATIAGMYATGVLGSAWVPVFSALLTISILVFSEIIPKTVGVVYWRSLWTMIAYPLRFMRFILTPIIFLTQKMTSKLTSGQNGASITEDEILHFVQLGAKEGEISREESQMIESIINLENIPIRKIMTPRRVAFSLNVSTDLKTTLELIDKHAFTRIPVYENDREHIIGYTMRTDIQDAAIEDEKSFNLKALVKPITFERDTANCLSLLVSFLKHRRHIAIVTDEFGGMDGIITLEDLLETAIGMEIVDETDQAVDLQKIAREKANKAQKPRSA